MVFSDESEHVSGQQLRAHARTWEKIIVGEEGPKYFQEGSFWLADGMTVAKLDEWMTEDNMSRTLWISSPFLPRGSMSGARAAALSVIASAWEANKAVISHFCKRPRIKYVTEGLAVEEAGLIGLTYSLINQLQQFVRDEELTEVRIESLQVLNGSKTSWATSLEILELLLRRTPHLSYCVIDGLDELEWNGGTKWCEEFLGVLMKHQEIQSPFNLLLTTTGQSRFLARAISLKERYTSLGTPKEVRIPGSK